MNARRTVRLYTATGLVIALAACNGFDEKRYLPTSADFQQALLLSVDRSSVPADGFSTATITASITKDAAPTKRTVVFTTTKGTFAGSGDPETATIESTVDASGSTSVLLRSSRSVESATISASVKTVDGLVKQQVVNFVAANASDTIQVSPSQTTAPADGASITQITAQIAAGLPASRRRVTFTTTMGTFAAAPGGTAPTDQGRKIEASADASNRVTVFLKSPVESAGDAFVSASVDTGPAVSATTSVHFDRARPDRMTITSAESSLTASFTSKSRITVTLVRDVGIPTQGTVVEFSAADSTGVDISFFSSVSTSNETGEVVATFSPGAAAMTGPAKIRATVVGTSVTATVTIQII